MAVKRQVGERRLYNLSELAIELQKDRKTVVRLLSGLEPDKQGGGKQRTVNYYFLSSVFKHIIEGEGMFIDNAEAQTRLNRERERAQRLKNEQLEEKLVDRESVFRSVKAMIATVKSRLLTMPSALASRLTDIDEQDDIEELIRAELIVILSDMSANEWKRND